jgi:O-antigen/teichoic acid export membrane protein
VGVASTRVNPQERLFGGTMLVLAAEALAFPAGLIATILLTRYLLPADYGALALALAGVAWLEWTVVSLYSRAAWKLTAEAADWRSVARPVVRVFLSTGLLLGVCVFAGADVAARMLSVPQLSPLLRVLALEIPVFATAHAYRSVLIGRGLHGSRAAVSAVRWIVRAILIAAGTLLGFSLTGITALIVTATCVELALAYSRVAGLRRADSPSAPSDAPAIITASQLLTYATPLAVSAICLRLLDRMDIFALRVFGGALENVAAYGVAQNLALGPGLFGIAFIPALVAAFSYRAARGDAAGARRLSGEALRAGFLLLALTLLAAGAARGLIELLFGARYAAAAPLFALLIVGAGATLLSGLAIAVLVGAGKLRWTVGLTVPLVLWRDRTCAARAPLRSARRSHRHHERCSARRHGVMRGNPCSGGHADSLCDAVPLARPGRYCGMGPCPAARERQRRPAGSGNLPGAVCGCTRIVGRIASERTRADSRTPSPCGKCVRVMSAAWSVIVPTYNRPQPLARCLAALARVHPPNGGSRSSSSMMAASM